MITRQENRFHHAIRFRGGICTGRSHCRSVCPTGAIRARHGIEAEESLEFLIEKYNEHISSGRQVRPMISPFCPAVVRLIQVKFPTLAGKIIPLKAPVEITAIHSRTRLADQDRKQV